MKESKYMKHSGIISALLLVSLLLLAGFAYAENGSSGSSDDDDDNEDDEDEREDDDNEEDELDDDSDEDEREDDEADEITSLAVNESEIKTLVAAARAKEKDAIKRMKFVIVSHATGWMTQGSDARLLAGIWLSQQQVSLNRTNRELITQQELRSGGKLKISGEREYALMRESNASNESVTFGVYDSRGQRSSRIGTLQLSRRAAYDGNTIIWDGTLSFDSGTLNGIWDVELASQIRRVNDKDDLPKEDRRELRTPNDLSDDEDEREDDDNEEDEDNSGSRNEQRESNNGKKFWKRIFFWKKD